MPQLNGGGGDDLGANDELISFKDEGEQGGEESENSSAERDLADVKSSWSMNQKRIKQLLRIPR